MTGLQHFFELPAVVHYERIIFQLELHGAGIDQGGRLLYKLSYVYQDSEHYEYYMQYKVWRNPFNKIRCDFLLSIENIFIDADLIAAVENCQDFLKIIQQ